MRIQNKKTFALAFILAGIIALVFWTQSRFPALDQKAQMGQRASISALAFDVIIPISAEQGYLERAFASSVNWSYTNWKGMTFGILFSAAIWLIFSLVQWPASRAGPGLGYVGHIKQAFYGGLFGSPLGVCANCSTPIAFGLYANGHSLTSSLALLSSSPSFNFIVLGMALSLLPLELVLIKYLFVLLFILIVIPFLTWRFGLSADNSASTCELPSSEPMNSQGDAVKGATLNNASSRGDFVESTWLDAFLVCARLYLDKLKRVVIGTLPFMMLAGVLAALVAEAFDLTALTEAVSFPVLAIVAVLGAFFPVPIAFDVVISVTLLAMGVDVAYVAALFFSLGVFSIYPGMMIARDVSKRLSAMMLLSVALLALLSAYTSSAFVERQAQQALHQIQDGLLEPELNEYLLPNKLAKPLMRQAARQCYALEASASLQCFERFVRDELHPYFNDKACVYLEDAVDYRQICENVFQYLKQSKLARVSDNPEACDETPSETYRQACLYDEVFERVLDLQSVQPCQELSSIGQGGQMMSQCLSEGLAMNFELYQNADACVVFKDKTLKQQCDNEFAELRQQRALFYQKSLEECEQHQEARDVRYCQGVTMVNRLEQGEDASLCKEISDAFLSKRCHDFAAYFDAISARDQYACDQVHNPSLADECRMESVIANLSDSVGRVRSRAIEFAQASQVAAISQQSYTAANAPVLEFSKVDFSQGALPSQGHQSLGAEPHGLTISYAPLKKRKPAVSNKIFKTVDPLAIGLLASPPLQMVELFEPFSYGRGIAAGDWNDDVWPDLVLAHHEHIRFYQNMGGRFTLALDIHFDDQLSPVLVMLVDLNGDGWLDCLSSFYGGKNRIYWNDNGTFSATQFSEFELDDSRLVMAAAAQDLNNDGLQDLVLGGWSAGDLRHFNPVHSQNYVLLNQTEKASQAFRYSATALSGAAGETLSLLLSDFNQDGQTELVVANDMDGPDVLYRWSGQYFEQVQSEGQQTLPWLSSFNTMSLAAGDINGDLKLDYFSADMTFGEDLGKQYCEQPGISDTAECQGYMTSEQALHEGRAAWCASLAEKERDDCYRAQLIQIAKQSRQPEYCQRLKNGSVSQRLCISASEALPAKLPVKLSDYIRSTQRNVLLVSGNNILQDQTETWGASKTYWAWNSAFSDVNNDGWLDLLVGNGFLFGGSGRNLQSNALLINQGGQSFERAEREQGFEDYLNTPSFVMLDYDLDGDLDYIANRVGANPAVLENQSTGKTFLIQLSANSNGAQLVFQTDQRALLRQVNLSGGFLSYSDTSLHFSLNHDERLHSVKIRWPGGDYVSFDGAAWKPGVYRIR